MSLPGAKASPSELARLLASRYPGARLSAETPVSRTIWPVSFLGREYLLKLHDPWIKGRLDLLNAVHEAAKVNSLTPPMAEDRDGRLLGLYDGLPYSLHERQQTDMAGPPKPDRLATKLNDLHRALACCGQGSKLDNHFRTDTAILAKWADQAGFPHARQALEVVEDLLRWSPVQLLHGDMHPGNVLTCGRELFFVDFDSAVSLPVQAEVAFAAETFYGIGTQEAGLFLAFYSRACGIETTLSDACRWLVFHACQRLGFIFEQADLGNEGWMADLQPQIVRLQTAIGLLEEF